MKLLQLLVCLLGASAIQPLAIAADTHLIGDGTCNKQVTYLSDTDSAYAYLEEEQRKVYLANPGLADPYALEELNSPRTVSSFADLKARALKSCPSSRDTKACALDPNLVDALLNSIKCLTLPTRFESPLFFALIDLYSKEMDPLRKAHYPKSELIRFGSLPTGVMNAQAILPPKSKVPLVILNRDIFFFTGAFSKSIANAIPIIEGKWVRLDHSEQGIRQRLRENPYIVRNFADAMSRLVNAGSSMGAEEVTLDNNHNLLHARLLGAMDRFLISHEQGHIVLGHTSEKSVPFHLANPTASKPIASAPTAAAATSRGVGGDPPTALKAMERTRLQELEADAAGFKLTMLAVLAGNDPIGAMVAAAAPHMVFQILDAADAYGKLIPGGWTFGDGNHPPASERVNALSPIYEEAAKGSAVLRQVDFRIPFNAALKILLAEADPLIRQRLGIANATNK